MSIAFGIAGAVLWAILALTGVPPLKGADWLALTESAAIWSAANFAYILAIDGVGIARSTAIKNLTGVFGTLAGVLLLGEILSAVRALAAVAGSFGIVFAAVLIAGAKDSSHPRTDAAAATDVRPNFGQLGGTLFGIAAALGYGLYLVPALPILNTAGTSSSLFVAVFSVVACVLTVWVVALFRWAHVAIEVPGRRDLGLPIIAGIVWFLGSLSVTPAASLIGLAISWPLSQMGFYIALAYAVWWLHEVDPKRQRTRLALASLATLAGMVFLAVARS